MVSSKLFNFRVNKASLYYKNYFLNDLLLLPFFEKGGKDSESKFDRNNKS